jgi:hypothetical protein
VTDWNHSSSSSAFALAWRSITPPKFYERFCVPLWLAANWGYWPRYPVFVWLAAEWTQCLYWPWVLDGAVWHGQNPAHGRPVIKSSGLCWTTGTGSQSRSTVCWEYAADSISQQQTWQMWVYWNWEFGAYSFPSVCLRVIVCRTHSLTWLARCCDWRRAHSLGMSKGSCLQELSRTHSLTWLARCCDWRRAHSLGMSKGGCLQELSRTHSLTWLARCCDWRRAHSLWYVKGRLFAGGEQDPSSDALIEGDLQSISKTRDMVGKKKYCSMLICA